MKFLLLIILSLAFSGCTTRVIVFPDGTTYTSRSFLTNPNIGPVSMKNNQHTGLEFTLGGYNHNQTDVADLVLAIAAKRMP
jgi:hypothetical protein